MFAMSYFHFLVRFDGRINRAKYWLVLILFFPFTAAFTIDHQPYGPYVDVDDVFGIVNSAAIRRALDALLAVDITSPATLFPILFRLIVTPLVAWCLLVTSIKRLHDRDRSGWWMIPFVVLPGIVKQFSPLTVSAPQTVLDVIAVTVIAAALVAVIGLYLWGLIELFLLKGTTGANRFGPDPLAGRVS
jgi:uncharacterized membrane protein YhaH (DUF805 family)